MSWLFFLLSSLGNKEISEDFKQEKYTSRLPFKYLKGSVKGKTGLGREAKGEAGGAMRS